MQILIPSLLHKIVGLTPNISKQNIRQDIMAEPLLDEGQGAPPKEIDVGLGKISQLPKVFHPF
jgi:hypothetical protein